MNNNINNNISTKDKTETISTTTATTIIQEKGIDVSSYQRTISWEKVLKTGIKFVILRSTIKNGSLDTKFIQNYNNAKAYGFDISVYHFSYALTVNKAISDAENLIQKLNGKKVVIWLDLEYEEQGKLGKNSVTEIASAFVKTCQNRGYECNIYSNLNWYQNYYYPEKLKNLGCKFWIARYGNNDGNIDLKYKPNVGETIWQYTDKGRINGISGYVDLNIRYIEKDNEATNDNYIKINKYIKVICTSIYKRKTPDSSISTNIVGTYKNNDIVKVIGTTKNNSWYIDTDGYYFTANKKWVNDLIGVIYNCYMLNVRKSANANSKIITVINVNDNVSILNQSENGWYYIQTKNGIKGWVNNNYVKI